MDRSLADHSDSDSGESWILLEQENSPAYADEAPDFAEKIDQRNTDVEKGEDTDGISIISDSDHESTPCEIVDEDNLDLESPPSDQIPQDIPIEPLPSKDNSRLYDRICNDSDFLCDTNGKLKTYVHKRNKRLSTVLNVIVLGSIITAAGIAIGHMWGVRDDCSMHTAPSVNKILSNLYKLQEENVYLRNKLKELSHYNNIQMQLKLDSPHKQHRCRKVFEESLENQNAEKFTKCVDNKAFASHMIGTDYEKEFLNDVKKLKDVYKQNRSWLDEEIGRRMKQEQDVIKAMKTKYEKLKYSKNSIFEKPLEPTERVQIATDNSPSFPLTSESNTLDIKQDIPDQKISYADSLKSDKHEKREKRDINEVKSNTKDHHHKKKPLKDYDIVSENSFAEVESRKDDRYSGQKLQRKKQDRQKIHKKQKRNNKYEQWEMKRGYLKYYDDISEASSQENVPDGNDLSKEFELNDMKQFSEAVSNTETLGDNNYKERIEKPKSKSDKGSGPNWYEKRVSLRNEARKKLEKELFGETNPNTAGWYFRRMQRREKFRIKGDNSTFRRQSKRNMNFKTRC